MFVSMNAASGVETQVLEASNLTIVHIKLNLHFPS